MCLCVIADFVKETMSVKETTKAKATYLVGKLKWRLHQCWLCEKEIQNSASILEHIDVANRERHKFPANDVKCLAHDRLIRFANDHGAV